MQTYTATETGLMGWQCSGGALHVFEDNAIVEIVDAADRPTQAAGEIVVTDLTNWATPIIRYRGLGDLGRWDSQTCPCGDTGRVLAGLEGRSTELLLRPDGAWTSPYSLTNALEKIDGIHHCQIVQHDARRLEVLVVRDCGSCSEDEIGTSIRRAAVAVLAGEVQCGVCFVDHIPPRGDGHKVPRVVSHVRRDA